MKKYVVGIRAKDSGVVRGLTVVEDVQSYVREIRAGVKANPSCAYGTYPDDYDIVCNELDCSAWNTVIEMKDGRDA